MVLISVVIVIISVIIILGGVLRDHEARRGDVKEVSTAQDPNGHPEANKETLLQHFQVKKDFDPDIFI